MAKFLDSSVFLHAYLRPTRKLSPAEENQKEQAVRILDKVENGEESATSVIHVSEVINIVESRLGLTRAVELLENLLATENLSVLAVARGEYEQALAVAARYGVSPNDAVAALISRDEDITEIFSFDKHFDRIPFVKRITE
jgi:hypothetical protein